MQSQKYIVINYTYLNSVLKYTEINSMYLNTVLKYTEINSDLFKETAQYIIPIFLFLSISSSWFYVFLPM